MSFVNIADSIYNETKQNCKAAKVKHSIEIIGIDLVYRKLYLLLFSLIKKLSLKEREDKIAFMASTLKCALKKFPVIEKISYG